ncbi:hypothetical protein [Streptomyces longisporoflavus]|uniref:Uncharacterized protein n=1 Tax=Streptomyces longisporoflavus TaxID=28044 RepID=A0ABW7QZY1_9ACTN
MRRRGRLVATVAAGVLAGLTGPAAAAIPAAHPGSGGTAHAMRYAGEVRGAPYAGDSQAVSRAAHPRAGGGADLPDATVTPTAPTAPATSATSSTSPSSDADDDEPARDGTIADTGAGVLPWIAAAAAGALGVGAVVFAMIRRRSE